MRSDKPYVFTLDITAQNQTLSLIERHAQTVAPITGRRGELIRSEKISTIMSKWLGYPACLRNYETCHWVTPESVYSYPDPDKPEDANDLDRDPVCLLDKYRRHWFPKWEWVIFGQKGLYVPPHRDMFGTGSWNLLVKGTRQWKFWNPTSDKDVYPDFTFIQSPNDAIWIPENWTHAVVYESASISISKNVVREKHSDSIANLANIESSNLSKLIRTLAAHNTLHSVKY